MEVLELVSIPFTQVEESVRHAKDVVPFADQAATCVAQTKYMASEHSIQVVLTSESQQRLGARLEGGSDREGGDPDVELGPFRKVCDCDRVQLRPSVSSGPPPTTPLVKRVLRQRCFSYSKNFQEGLKSLSDSQNGILLTGSKEAPKNPQFAQKFKTVLYIISAGLPERRRYLGEHASRGLPLV